MLNGVVAEGLALDPIICRSDIDEVRAAVFRPDSSHGKIFLQHGQNPVI